MKTKRTTLLAGCILAGLLTITVVGCKYIGELPSAPTHFEETVFNVKTNFVDKIVLHTNEVFVDVPRVVFRTNEQNEVVWETNHVKVATTEVTLETNKVPAYTLTPKESGRAAITTGATVVNGFWPGAGGLLGGLATGLYAMWGKLRSAKVKAADATQTGGVLAQNIETIREFLKTVPNGEKYDAVIVNYLQQHQMESGVADNVLDLLQNNVSNDTAKATVSDLRTILQRLSAPAT